MTVRLREAGAADSALLFEWVNSPDSLANKERTEGPIRRAEHECWFAKRLGDPATRIWIVETDDQPVGQVRLQCNAGVAEVDIYIATERRGQGHARAALRDAIHDFRRSEPDTPVVARVLADNAASRALFESLGFDVARTDAALREYRLVGDAK